MIKAHYDPATGVIKGFYPGFIAYAAIPEPTIEISEAEWNDCLQNNGARRVDTETLRITEYVPVVTLADLQAAKWDEIKAAREAASNAPIEYLGKLFDFDEKARNNLRDAVIAAQSASALSIPFPDVEWTLYDNTTATLTHTELLAFPLQAGIVRIGAVHAYARTLRDEIFKVGATVASVAAVKWAYTDGE